MQVEVIRTYTAKQPDELSLQVADVVLVSQTVEDGTLAFNALPALSLSFFSIPLISLLPDLSFYHALLYTLPFNTCLT